MNNKKSDKFIVLTLLLSSYLLAFSWVQQAYYLIFIMSVYAILQALNHGTIPRKYCYAIVFVFFATLISSGSGLLMGLAPKYSWIIQFNLIPLIALCVFYVYRRNVEIFFIYGKRIFILCVATQALQFIINLYYYGGAHFLSYENILFGDVYNFANISAEKIGLMKGVIPWLAILFYFLSKDQFTKKQSVILFTLSAAFALTVGAKTTLIGIAFVVLFEIICSIKKYKSRIATYYIVLAAIALLIEYFSKELNQITIFNGRYFGPVFTSIDFWSSPFGVGVGNYTDAAKIDLYKIDTSGYFATIWIHSEDMSDQFSWFPVAESDIILLAVTFGWFNYLIILLFIFNCIHKFIKNYHTKNVEQVKGFQIFIFLICSGIFQDWINVQAYYVFLGLAFSLMYGGAISSVKTKHVASPSNFSRQNNSILSPEAQ